MTCCVGASGVVKCHAKYPVPDPQCIQAPLSFRSAFVILSGQDIRSFNIYVTFVIVLKSFCYVFSDRKNIPYTARGASRMFSFRARLYCSGLFRSACTARRVYTALATTGRCLRIPAYLALVPYNILMHRYN